MSATLFNQGYKPRPAGEGIYRPDRNRWGLAWEVGAAFQGFLLETSLAWPPGELPALPGRGSQAWSLVEDEGKQI